MQQTTQKADLSIGKTDHHDFGSSPLFFRESPLPRWFFAIFAKVHRSRGPPTIFHAIGSSSPRAVVPDRRRPRRSGHRPPCGPGRRGPSLVSPVSAGRARGCPEVRRKTSLEAPAVPKKRIKWISESERNTVEGWFGMILCVFFLNKVVQVLQYMHEKNICILEWSSVKTNLCEWYRLFKKHTVWIIMHPIKDMTRCIIFQYTICRSLKTCLKVPRERISKSHRIVQKEIKVSPELTPKPEMHNGQAHICSHHHG